MRRKSYLVSSLLLLIIGVTVLWFLVSINLPLQYTTPPAPAPIVESSQATLPSSTPIPTTTPRQPIIPFYAQEVRPGVYFVEEYNPIVSQSIGVVYIDLANTPLQALVTPLENGHLVAQNVQEFAARYDCPLAINGGGFGPITNGEPAPWNRFNQPFSGSSLWAAGFTASRGNPYSPPNYAETNRPILFISESNYAHIGTDIPANLYNAITSFGLLIQDGQLIDQANQDLHPRTAIGISKDSKVLIILVVDGRQPNKNLYGASLKQLGQILLNMGAYQGVNMDGGGSSTLVINGEVVNSPANPTGFLRPVGPSLGFCNN